MIGNRKYISTQYNDTKICILNHEFNACFVRFVFLQLGFSPLVSGCMTVEEIKSELQLNSESQTRLLVVGTSITEWQSVHSALQTLCDLILHKSTR